MLVAGIVLTGCSSGSSSTDASSSAGGNADVGAKAPAPEQVAGQPAAGAETAKDSPDLSIDQRSIIYTGSMSVRVKDVTTAATQATGIASTAGGFIGSDDRERTDGDDTATMQLRVPAEKFVSVVDQLSKLGNEESRKIGTEDVTEKSIDLDARIGVQQAQVDSARKLLASAKTLSDLVMLEKEVATRESDLASLQASKRHLADLVALSTITVTFLKQGAPAPPAKKVHHGFVGGLLSGWHALTASLTVLLTVLGALLPWLIGIVLPVGVVYYLIRRAMRARRSARTPASE